MQFLFIALFAAIGIGISWWNAYVCGRVWEDSKTYGGFLHVLVWCAAIQSAVGFSGVYYLLLMLAVTPMLDYTPEEMEYFWRFGGAFYYLLIIFPVLGSGLVITIHSWMEAIRNRSFTNVAVAGWNTFSQISNLWNAFINLGEVFKIVADGFAKMFAGADNKGKAAFLALLIVIVALMLGVLTTVLLIKRYARTAKQVLTPEMLGRSTTA